MVAQKPCIYRVPSQLREGNPEAYRPRMLLIGPLTHSAKPKAHEDSRFLEYKMMEDQKVLYKAAFTKRPNAVAFLVEMVRIIRREEVNIRASYVVSTEWIKSDEFKRLILNDSIFIVEFIIRIYENENNGDVIANNLFYCSTIYEDLTLLENQLPYVYLKMLLDPIIKTFCNDQTLDQVIHQLFSVDGLINEATKFNHFTDMFRCVYKESLGTTETLALDESEDLMNADELSSVGVKFKVRKEDLAMRKMRKCSLDISLDEGCLTMPTFPADEASFIILRNVIAYEQCHDPENAFTTNYIHFVNFLVTSDKDVEILSSAGVLTKGVGRPSMVLETVNNLLIGVLLPKQTQYYSIVEKLNTHYKSRRKRMWTRLKRVYFNDPWTTTATLAAISLLLLTIAGTVASIIQAKGVKTSASSSVGNIKSNP